MTRGISEERLKILLKKENINKTELAVLEYLIKECTEINPWMPIESAPDEGSFLVYMPEEKTKIQVAKYHPNINTIGNNFAFDLTKPTHWCELPQEIK